MAVLGLCYYAGFSLVVASGGNPLVAAGGLLMAACCRAQALGLQWLWLSGSRAVTLKHLGSSQTRDRTGWCPLRWQADS